MIVSKCSFLLLSIVTAVKESVCIVILFLVPLASSSANRMAVIGKSWKINIYICCVCVCV